MRKSLPLLVLAFVILGCSPSKRMSIPHTLLFSPITPEYLRDSVADWGHTRFDGFLLSGIMRNWLDDIWATDGDSTTRGKDDKTFQRVKSCNDACFKYGITENFIKVAFYKHVPLWTDDAAWKKLEQNFAEAARFAKMSRCRGIALDIEYVSEQYDLDWKGYDYKNYSKKDLRTAAIKRGRELVQAMLQNYPKMVFLNLPEGIEYYGPLATDLFVGMVQGMAEANAPGGLHLLTEHSYSMTSVLGLLHYVQKLQSDILKALDNSSSQYWNKKCSIALGGWPLGYYRSINDENGNFLGYSGHKEIFGDRVVGSYADKSSRFSPQEFRNQYAGMLLGSKYYCWIYGHGATWWQFSDADVKKYGNVGNSALPVDEQLDAFKNIIRHKWMGTPRMRELALMVRENKKQDFMNLMGFMKTFQVIGPFGCQTCNNFSHEFPPEKEINFAGRYKARTGTLKWQKCSVDPETGYLDFVKYFKPKDWVCAYAFCKVTSPGAIDAQIRLGTNDTGTLWFNGKEILAKNTERAAMPDADVLPVHLRQGENNILIKVCNTELNWGLYLRVTDADGNPLHGLTFWP